VSENLGLEAEGADGLAVETRLLTGSWGGELFIFVSVSKKALANCSPSRSVDSIILNLLTFDKKSPAMGIVLA
jgi:hypothetical protein